MRKVFVVCGATLVLAVAIAIVAILINKEKGVDVEVTNLERTGWASEIPAGYEKPATEQGVLQDIEYDSKDYTNDESIQRQAVVYLPFNYDESQKYNTFYLMHGWTGHAGDFFEHSDFKNILDNLIERGDIEPLIVVAPTFDAENKSQDWGRSVEEINVFHNDFSENLVPYIEANFAANPSREYRGFGGFSLGGVTTWSIFEHNLDLVKYYLPMSGDSWCIETFGGLYEPVKTVDYLEKIAENTEYDYFIAAYLGTKDARYDQVNNQMVEMLKRDTFKDTFVYYQVKDAQHDFGATDIDLYNGLQLLFKNERK